MKQKHQELNVDIIGGGRPLTMEDEIAISNFIRMQKEKSKPVAVKRKIRTTRKRTHV
ncbi:MAG: hypothetical protein SH857_15705 [Chitinophagales bacterium]|nr:hypothetical protein [Chitinophagales bacterium]